MQLDVTLSEIPPSALAANPPNCIPCNGYLSLIPSASAILAKPWPRWLLLAQVGPSMPQVGMHFGGSRGLNWRAPKMAAPRVAVTQAFFEVPASEGIGPREADQVHLSRTFNENRETSWLYKL